MDNWISVYDRLPDRDGRYLVFRKGGYDIASFYGAEFFGIAASGITHWMPLPEPPKMKGGEGYVRGYTVGTVCGK